MNKLITRIITGFMPSKANRVKFREKHKYDDIIGKLDNIIKFVKTGINNSEYTEFNKSLYHIFCNAAQNTMNTFITDKISKDLVLYSINKLHRIFPNKKLLFLTDTNYEVLNCTKIKTDDIETYKQNDDYIYVVGYNKDFLALDAIKKLSSLNLKYQIIEQASPITRYFQVDKIAMDTLIDEAGRLDKLPHFCPIDFENIFQALVQTKNLIGDYVEIGTFQGASARATLNYMKRAGINRKTYFIDTYEGFTYEEAKNSKDACWQNTHTETSVEQVTNFLSGYKNINIVKSNIISDELPSEIKDIAVANIDVDMYDAIKASLYKVKDKIVQNGIILMEDFGHTPWLIGAQKAFFEFIEENQNEFITLLGSGSQMFLIKK